jgi:hypothetical protein
MVTVLRNQLFAILERGVQCSVREIRAPQIKLFLKYDQLIPL